MTEQMKTSINLPEESEDLIVKSNFQKTNDDENAAKLLKTQLTISDQGETCKNINKHVIEGVCLNITTKPNDKLEPEESQPCLEKGNSRSGLDRDHISEKMKPRFFPAQPQTLAVIRQYMVGFIASLPFGVAGTAIAWPSPILPKFLANETPFSLNVVEISWMVSLLYLGNLASPIPAGYLANRFGRRKSLLYSGFIPVFSWLLILFSSSSLPLYIARFLIGLQFGLVSTIQPIFIGEIAQANIRGTLSTLNNLTLNSGLLFTFVVGPFVSYQTLAMVLLVIPFLFLVTFPYMPESPYYYYMKGESEKATESLFWLRGDLNRIELEVELDQIEKFVQNQMQKEGSFRDIFLSKASRKAITISIVFSAIKRLSGNGVIQAFATVTLPPKTFGILTPNDCVMVLGVITVLSSVLASCVADSFGRRTLLIVSCMGCSLSMFTVSLWFYLDSKTDVDMSGINFIPLLGYIVQTVTYNLACGPIGGTVKGELFPPHVKTKSSSLATMTLAITSFILNRFYLVISELVGMYLNYFIFGVSCFLGVLFTVFYVPETKGKTLQEIQDILSGVERRRITTPVLSRTF